MKRFLGIADALALGLALGLLLGLAESPVLRDVLALLVPLGAGWVLTRPASRPPPGTPALATVGLVLGLLLGTWARVGEVFLGTAVEHRRAVLESLDDASEEHRHLLTRWIFASAEAPTAKEPDEGDRDGKGANGLKDITIGNQPGRIGVISADGADDRCPSSLPDLLKQADEPGIGHTGSLDNILSARSQDRSLRKAEEEIEAGRARHDPDPDIHARLLAWCRPAPQAP